MALFSPNVKRLRDQRDVRGLMRALRYVGTSKKAEKVRCDAVHALAGHPYTRVVQELMEVGLGGSFENGIALASVRRILYPYHQKHDELIAWWTSGNDTRGELRALLDRNRASSHIGQWDAVRRSIEDRIKPPMHIELLIQSGISGHNEITDEQSAEAHRWMKDRDEKVASELEAARAELEAKWAAAEITWAEEEAALEKWAP
jgi:hypothetical protein